MDEDEHTAEQKHPLQKLQSDVLQLWAELHAMEARLTDRIRAISETLERRNEQLPQ